MIRILFYLSLALTTLATTGCAVAAESNGATVSQQQAVCGLKPDDWCPAPAGDPCGRHHNVATCRADSSCYGMPYKGESLTACTIDSRGFSSNCPTVGCTSTPPHNPEKSSKY